MSRKYKFKAAWLSRQDALGYEVSRWCKRSNNPDSELFCQICLVPFSFASKGFEAVIQHSSSIKHTQQAQTKLPDKQLKLEGRAETTTCATAQLKPMQLCSNMDPVLKAEIVWALKNTHSNMSAASCDDLKEVFQTMFPGSISDSFSLGRTKLLYLVTEALGPYFMKIVTDDIQHASSYCLSYDETTNAEQKKELQITVRYFSETDKEVVNHHLRTFFIGHATADILAEHLNKAIDEADIPKTKLIMLGSDGPNVNKKVWSILNAEEIELRGRGLLNIGSCNIHTIHNAFLKGLGELGSEASDFILQVYYFFHGWPARCEDFENIQLQQKLPKHNFLKHVSTRWLTLQPSAERVLEQWKALEKYFLSFIPNQKNCKSVMNSQKYLVICKYLRQKTMKAELHFVIDSAALFTKFTLGFQKDEPLIHILFDELRSLLLTLAGRVCKVESLERYNDKKLKGENLFTESNLLPIKSVVVPKSVEDCFSDNELSEKDKLLFLQRAQSHFNEAAIHVMKKSSLEAYSDSNMIYWCRCLQPNRIKKKISCADIVKVAEALPLVEDISLTALADEWRLMQLETLSESKAERVDHYWQKNVFSLKNANNDRKYPIISRVVKACFSLSHGSADVERGFSLSKRILSDDKAAMSERTLNARLAVRDGIKKFKNKPHLVPITQDLLTRARLAHQSYKSYLETEKRNKDKASEIVRNEELRIEQEKENLAQMETRNENIKKLETDLEEKLKQQRLKKQSADKLVSEANTRLQSALKEQNMQEIQMAQGLIEGAERLREQEREQEKAACKIAKEVQKRKSKLISDFMSKKPKK